MCHIRSRTRTCSCSVLLRGRANVARLRQNSLGFMAKVLQTFEGVPSSLGSGHPFCRVSRRFRNCYLTRRNHPIFLLYSIANCRGYGLIGSGLFNKSFCSPLCGSGPPRPRSSDLACVSFAVSGSVMSPVSLLSLSLSLSPPLSLPPSSLYYSQT